MTSVALQANESGPVSVPGGRIRPPYRFIEEFDVRADGTAEASPSLSAAWPPWASPLARTALPIEWAAQLYGASARLAAGRSEQTAYLAGVRKFRWACAPVRIAHLSVAPISRRGAFHEFTADFFSPEGSRCAYMTGALFLPPEPGPVRASESPGTGDAEAKLRGDGGDSAVPAASGRVLSCGSHRGPRVEDAPFRVISDLSAGDGRMRGMTPDPGCPVYAGHFPGEPIVPGVLLLEAMIETGQALIPKESRRRPSLHGVRDATFQALVRPGDALLVEVKNPRREGRVLEFQASVFRQGRRVARAKPAFDAIGVVARCAREG